MTVDALKQSNDGRWTVTAGKQSWNANAVVLALSIDQMQAFQGRLPEDDVSTLLASRLEAFTTSPYITTHLWFDQPFTDLHHAALLDTRHQWMFHKSRIRSWPEERGSYVELVIGGSRDLLPAGRAELIQLAMDELTIFFPDARKVKLVKSGVLKEARATFSVTPGLDNDRPGALSPWPGIVLAGDWTATDWPSTMESAARSGYLAAEAVAAAAGSPITALCPELTATGLMKLFA